MKISSLVYFSFSFDTCGQPQETKQQSRLFLVEHRALCPSSKLKEPVVSRGAREAKEEEKEEAAHKKIHDVAQAVASICKNDASGRLCFDTFVLPPRA